MGVADHVAGCGIEEDSGVELHGRGDEGTLGARLARIRAKGLADIFGRLWRGAFGKSGGLNRGGIGLRAGTEVDVGAGASWVRLAATVLDFGSYGQPPSPSSFDWRVSETTKDFTPFLHRSTEEDKLRDALSLGPRFEPC